MNLRKPCVLVALLASSIALAQPAAPASPLASSLGQLDQVARQTVLDLGRVRVDKWKADGSVKDQARDNSNSLQKNLSSALPSLMQQVQSNPSSVGAALKLYRNLNAVYDVLASVTESVGAFGSKDDFQALSTDIANLDTLRRTLANQLEQMASTQDAAFLQLQNQLRAQQQAAAAAATPLKKVIVDDTEQPKKAVPKKKKSAPQPPASQSQ